MSTAAEREALAGIGKPHVLREYALLADGERGVVVGPRGDYAWMCFPRWDSDACFATLIGGQGTYAVTPVSRYVWGGYYEHGLIWRNRWTTDQGVVECREALALPSSPERAVVPRSRCPAPPGTPFPSVRAGAATRRRTRRLPPPTPRSTATCRCATYARSPFRA